MTSQSMAADDSGKRGKRLAGIWLLTLVNVVFLLPVPALMIAPYFDPTILDGYHRGSPEIRMGLFLFFASIAVFSVGVLFKSRSARNGLIVLLTIYQIVPLSLAIPILSLQTTWFWLPLLSVHAIWLAANYWYLLGRPARQLFMAVERPVHRE